MTPGSKEWPPLSETKEWFEPKHILGFIAAWICGGISAGPIIAPVWGFGIGLRWSDSASSNSCWSGWTEEPVSQMVPDISTKRSWLTQDSGQNRPLQRLTGTSGDFPWTQYKNQLRTKHPLWDQKMMRRVDFKKKRALWGYTGYKDDTQMKRNGDLKGRLGLDPWRECGRFHRLNLHFFFVWKCRRLHNCPQTPLGRKLGTSANVRNNGNGASYVITALLPKKQFSTKSRSRSES